MNGLNENIFSHKKKVTHSGSPRNLQAAPGINQRPPGNHKQITQILKFSLNKIELKFE